MTSTPFMHATVHPRPTKGSFPAHPCHLGHSPESFVTTLRSDNEIMLAISAGDRDALGELYERYAAAISAFGLRFVAEDALHDIVHDVFLEAWEKACDYDPIRGTVLTWLAVRLRSRCIDRVRKANRRSELLAEHADVLRPRQMTPPGTAIVERSRLRTAVSELDDDLRDVTQLAYFEGASTAEIAKRLDLAQGTVKSRMRRARRSLYVAMTVGAT